MESWITDPTIRRTVGIGLVALGTFIVIANTIAETIVSRRKGRHVSAVPLIGGVSLVLAAIVLPDLAMWARIVLGAAGLLLDYTISFIPVAVYREFWSKRLKVLLFRTGQTHHLR